MAYVDGFVMAVEKARLEEYRRFSENAGRKWMAQGATSYVECLAEDVPYGELTSFPRAVQLKEDEVVVFSWITYPSKAERDRVMAAMMADPELSAAPMPFDGKRMIFGGFEPIIELGKGA